MPCTIAERINHARRLKGWTAKELAMRASLNQTHMWKILQGHRPRIEAETIRRLAVALEVSSDYLLGLKDTCHG